MSYGCVIIQSNIELALVSQRRKKYSHYYVSCTFMVNNYTVLNRCKDHEDFTPYFLFMYLLHNKIISLVMTQVIS